MFDIQEELKKLPDKPGVYLMHDKHDNIIYVGKAVILKNRVRQYFQSSRNKTAKIQKMVSQIAWFEYIITDSELEALVLECNLIKEHRPKYNTMLKDDKGYPYIKVTVQEEYPRILFAREMKRDKARYFGPYTSAGAVKETIELVRKLYHIRSCNKKVAFGEINDRVCLYYHMKQCAGPCQGNVDPDEYGHQVQEVMEFLNGNDKPVIAMLEERMKTASETLDFEAAAEYRDMIQAVMHVSGKQKVNTTQEENRDVIALATDGENTVVSVFFVRDGKLLGREHFHMSGTSGETKEMVISQFIRQYYAGTPYLPREIIVQYEAEEREILEEWLTERVGQKVSIVCPKKGNKQKLVELVYENAANVLIKDGEKLKREEERTIGAVHELEKLLGLPNLKRMEAFDISNTNGYQGVASMIVFEDGKPKRNAYRRFRLRTVVGPDDYKSMEETLTRRFLHGQKDREDMEFTKEREQGFAHFPDIIMMDGGKGQVNVALQVLERLGLQIPVCGMVKDDNHRTRGLYYNNEEIQFPKNSSTFQLLTRMQDEAHRFAITYHKLLRNQTQIHSVLDDIPGVGPVKRKALMRYFKDIQKIKQAEVEELTAVEGITKNLAETIYEFFHQN
ncbi:MAG: excinuclease ABC subunit UvrC [Lachnospiraceae bacterium]